MTTRNTIVEFLAACWLLLVLCSWASSQVLVTLPQVSVALPRVVVQPAPVYALPIAPSSLQSGQDFQIGTVFTTRNYDERLNRAPFSYWNHNAIYVGNGWIIESMEGIGVRRVPVADLWRRNYSQIIVQRPTDALCGQVAARRAEWLVGRPYAPYSSLWPFYGRLRLGLGLNCTSVIEFGYGVSGVTTPDDVVLRYQRCLLPPEWAPVQPPQYSSGAKP